MNRWIHMAFGCANPDTSKGEYFNPDAVHFPDEDLDAFETDISD
ncbi:MAG: hypothetical protein QY315_10920 [Saprospiraceae bacterium]|nr:MAG: hypothetical protein QY315_10920 [Saprospiraceae bacterium]